MPRPRPWTDEQFVDAVASSPTLLDVCRRLGVAPGGKTYASIRHNIRRLGMDASHLRRLEPRGKRSQAEWSDDDLGAAVRSATTIADVLRALGYQPSGGMHRFIKGRIAQLGLDTSHFTGQSWARGRRRPPDQVARDLESLLVRGGYFPSSKLRERLIRAGLKQRKCEQCGRDGWRGQPLPLHLDHINGDPCDNRLENLRILCPNCHALTDTWCGRKRKPA